MIDKLSKLLNSTNVLAVFTIATFIAIMTLLLSQRVNTQSQFVIIEDVLPCTSYTWADDGLKPHDPNYGIAFTGVKATADHVIAIDPIYWSQRLGLEYNHEWPQSRKVQADVFWKVIFWDIDNDRVYFPRDIGGAVKQKRIDISFGDATPQALLRSKLFGKQYRRFVIIANKASSFFDQDKLNPNQLVTNDKRVTTTAGDKHDD